jgi:DnaJ-class molecular chaperone
MSPWTTVRSETLQDKARRECKACNGSGVMFEITPKLRCTSCNACKMNDYQMTKEEYEHRIYWERDRSWEMVAKGRGDEVPDEDEP